MKYDFKIYDMANLNSATIPELDYLLIAGGSDFRAYESLRILNKRNILVRNVLFFDFDERKNESTQLKSYLSYKELTFNFHEIQCSVKDPSGCIKLVSKLGFQFVSSDRIGIDISCFTKPYFFTIIKFLKNIIKLHRIEIFYTEPESYVFAESLLESYHSTSGPLSVMEMPGFPGAEARGAKKILIILLGFDGELSSFIVDEISPDEIIVVNGFPGYFPKFKDISLINNEKIIAYADVNFSKANNPFEVYNLLTQIKSKYLNDNVALNIAPLGTKPMALGACLFAIDNDSARMVYPLPEKYEGITTAQSWNSWHYSIELIQ